MASKYGRLQAMLQKEQERQPSLKGSTWYQRDEEKYFEWIDRNRARVHRWALQQEKEVLIERFVDVWQRLSFAKSDLADSAAQFAVLSEISLRMIKAGGRGAAVKLAKDPKQAARAHAFTLWKDWQAGKTLHKSGAAFHRYVLEKCPSIVDTKTVARWCKAWATQIRK